MDTGVTSVPRRASQSDRDSTVRTLRRGCAEERLSLDTFAERVAAAYAARSRPQLDQLVADLPAPSPFARAGERVARLWSGLVSRARSAWLEPRTPGLALPADGSVTLGRSHDCDCVLADATVSRVHARLRRGDGTWLLRDLGSSNGTRLNGYRVLGEVEVRPGDHVSFGAMSFRLGPPR
jgi:FHA domain-containing protein/uncharacterized protein DUF1707